MKKCPKCGTEFAGDFCPECGTKVVQVKTCPNCGTKVKAESNFCNECGYPFEMNETPEVQAVKAEQPKKEKVSVIAWLKSHLKIVVPVTIILVIAIILAITIPTCVAAKDNGTYYKLNYNGELDKKTYFTINSGKWSDEDGESGTYKKDGEKITFYMTFMGETEELCDGTISDGVLKIKMGMGEDTYVSEKHKHNYGEWETTREATCTTDGLETRTCACGVKETREIPATGTLGLKYQLNEEQNGYVLTGKGTATDTEIVIPKIYNNLPVIAIGNDAFRGCNSLTSIIIPDCVTSIGYGAFYGCTGIIQIENGVQYVNKWVVGCDTSLTNVIIRKDTKGIASFAFDRCSMVTSITIPNEVTYINFFAFLYCSSLTKLTVDSRNKYYHSESNCIIETASKTLIVGCKTSVIPTDGSVTSIGDGAFYGCISLTNIIIPSGIVSIGNFAFYGCESLSSLTIPNRTIFIGEAAFSGCTGFTNIIIPNSVTSIGQLAFSGCSELTILCESKSKPSGWDSNWNRIYMLGDYIPVIWGYKH